MNTILIIIAVILFIVSIVLYFKGKEKDEKNARLLSNKVEAHKEIEKLQKSIVAHEVGYRRVEIDLPTTLRYLTEDGDIAHNVKIKTIKDADENIIGTSATIRRKVKNDWVEVPVIPVILRPS